MTDMVAFLRAILEWPDQADELEDQVEAEYGPRPTDVLRHAYEAERHAVPGSPEYRPERDTSVSAKR